MVGGPIRQPYTWVDFMFIPKSEIYEFGYCISLPYTQLHSDMIPPFLIRIPIQAFQVKMNARCTCFSKLFSCPLIEWLHVIICHRWSGSCTRQQDPFSFYNPLNFTSCFNKVKTPWEDHEGATGCWDRIIDQLSCLKTWVNLLSQLTFTIVCGQRVTALKFERRDRKRNETFRTLYIWMIND